MSNKFYIGMNIYHPDTSIAAICNNEIIFAIEEERLNRIKHFSGFPEKSLNLFKKKFFKPEDELFFYLNTNPKSSLVKKGIYLARNLNFNKIQDFKRNFKKFKTKKRLEEIFQKKISLNYANHHLCHVLHSRFSTNFKESILVSIDAFGDFKSCEIFHLKNDEIKLINSVYFPHSLGVFYTALTQFCGFNEFGDEYKLMGLTAHGKYNSKFDKLRELISISNDKLFELNLKYFIHHNSNISYSWDNKKPEVGKLFNKFRVEELLGIHQNITSENFIKYSDIAYMTQQIYEETLFSILKRYDNISDNLILSGGCSLNCLANGKIKKNTNFKNIHINFAPGDNGGAIGAALFGYSKKFNNEQTRNIKNLNSPYLGTKYTNQEILPILKNFQDKIKYKKLNKKDLHDFVSIKLKKNKIFAYFNGKMEFGPRSLGARSILANPINPKNKELLNLKIKKREKFRPFAPVVLSNKQNEFFINSWDSPYMSFVFESNKNSNIPSALNIDKSGRVQTLKKGHNNNIYEIIKKFGNLTNVYALINTSFNKHEPIIENPKNAIETYLKTEIDYLIIENYLIHRK